MLRSWLKRLPGGSFRIALALTLVVGASALFWASRDYGVIAPDWDGQVRGIAYSASHLFTQDQAEHVTPERIDKDMAELATITSHIRTYTVSHGMERVPEIARRYDMTVSLGIWIGPDLEANRQEIDTAVKVALANRRTVDRVFVGNESILRGDVTPDQLNAYIREVRAALPNRIKVSTAEPWSTWLLNPDLGRYVDFVAIHLLPYWEQVDVRGALVFDQHAFEHIRDEFPDKPIVIGETGWPSEGRTRGNAEASLANQAYYIRNFVQMAQQKGYDYYLMEAYDQPWKNANEGAVGAYWGMFGALGTAKYPFSGLLRSFPAWRTYALGASVLTLFLGLLILSRMPRVRQPGYLVMGGLVALISTGLLFLIDAASLEYVDVSDLAMLIAMLPLVVLAATVILTEGVELAASLWRVERRQLQASMPVEPPRVSIHVPCYNEPSEMVIETLDALARMDYSNFEVILLDNNTPDPAVWEPVKAHCERLGQHFRFYHFDAVKGFKAGALNIALSLTDPAARYIAVIDSDYKVEPLWLKRALPYFASEEIALVQGPQDYRDGGDNIFKRMCFEEYRGFFHIGMVERNEHDAIIQHGTMTIVRKDALQAAGGWSEWCITEDTELGLKLFEAGYSAAYIPESMGQGLTPDTLSAFMSQRYRWVYGAMQIMKRHAREIFLGNSKLDPAQRYQFLTGWLPWISDGLSLIITMFALLWTLLMTLDTGYFDVPLATLSAAAVALFLAKTIKTLLLYPQKVGSGFTGALMASTAGLALTHTCGKAVLAGLFTSKKPFLRTPKLEDPADLGQVLRQCWQECLLLSALWLGVVAMILTALNTGRGLDDPAALLWTIMLGIQSLPYLATVITATLSAWSYARPAGAAAAAKGLAKAV